MGEERRDTRDVSWKSEEQSAAEQSASPSPRMSHAALTERQRQVDDAGVRTASERINAHRRFHTFINDKCINDNARTDITHL